MSTTVISPNVAVGQQSTIPAAPVVHASWWSKAGTWLLKIGHAIKHGLGLAVATAPKIATAINTIAPTIEAVSDMVVPGSGTFEAHLLDVYGYVAKAVSDAGAAATAVTINTPAGSLALDQQLVSDIKNFLPSVQAYMHPAANASAAPSATPTSSK